MASAWGSETCPPDHPWRSRPLRPSPGGPGITPKADSGIIENIGAPLPFQLPYWAGGRPAGIAPCPAAGEETYALPFHPLDLGGGALRALFGFIQEGRPQSGDVDAEAIEVYGLHVRDPHGPDHAEQEAALRRAVEAMVHPGVQGRDRRAVPAR